MELALVPGKKVGKLLLIEKVRSDKHYSWKCLCDCGKEYVTRAENFKRRKFLYLKSCGCSRSEMLSQTTRKRKGDSATRKAYSGYKSSAKKRNMKFELTLEQFKVMTQEDCFYCGTQPKQVYRGHRDCGDYTYNGIDRVENSLGYVFGNCVTACRLCNQAKHDRSLEEFEEWLERISYTMQYRLYKKKYGNSYGD